VSMERALGALNLNGDFYTLLLRRAAGAGGGPSAYPDSLFLTGYRTPRHQRPVCSGSGAYPAWKVTLRARHEIDAACRALSHSQGLRQRRRAPLGTGSLQGRHAALRRFQLGQAVVGDRSVGRRKASQDEASQMRLADEASQIKRPR